jgi:neutral ceramidase
MIKVGTGKANLAFPDGLGLFGFGIAGGAGLNVPVGSSDSDTLQARALYLEQGPTKLLMVSYDLPSGSRVVHRALLELLRQRGFNLQPGQLWVAGTHSHSAPGHCFGNIYDVFGQNPLFYRHEVALEVVRKGLDAALVALHAPAPCRVGVATRVLFAAGRNRSLRPFLANFDGDPNAWLKELNITPPASATPEERAVDPRLNVVAFVGRDDRPLATWATWCCHPASIRRAPLRAYHRDWPGVAVDKLESEVPFALVNQAANGDVTALPSGARRVTQPMQRVSQLGTAVAGAWLDAFREAAARASSEASFEIGYHTLVPAKESLPKFEIGAAVIAGSEEFDPPFPTKAFGEARRFPFRGPAQRPKRPALGPLQWLLRPVKSLQPSPEHPIGMLRLADHVFFASPFEQTTYAARTTEKELCARWQEVRGERITASPIGLVGDYAGYLATPAEYELQHYEGGHTLYGPKQREVLGRIWTSMVREAPLDASPPAYEQRERGFQKRVDAIRDALSSGEVQHAVDPRISEHTSRI